MKRWIFIVLTACLFLFVGSACSEQEPPPQSPQSPQLTEITVEGMYKTRYLVGDVFDDEGMLVIAYYSDGSAVAVSDYTVSPATALSLNDTKITIGYGGMSETVSIAVGQDPVVDDGFYQALAEEFARETYEKNGNILPYRVRTPDDTSRKAPVVLFLHGAGERGSDNTAQLKNAVLTAFSSFESMFYDSYVIAPQCPMLQQWVNTPFSTGNYSMEDVPESAALSLVYQLVLEYAEMEEVDADCIYVIGISMGGYATWDLLMRHGDLFAAGVPICGAGDPDKADELSEIPIYTFHGDRDMSVPYAGTEEMFYTIQSYFRGNIFFVPFAGEGHIIWDEAINYPGDRNNPPLQEWLFSQRKGW